MTAPSLVFASFCPISFDDVQCFRIQNQSIEIFELRPGFNDPQRMIEIPVVKTTWVRTQKVWRVFWQQADMKWHLYLPQPEVKSLEEFIDAVEADEHACFYGSYTLILCPHFDLDSLSAYHNLLQTAHSTMAPIPPVPPTSVCLQEVNAKDVHVVAAAEGIVLAAERWIDETTTKASFLIIVRNSTNY